MARTAILVFSRGIPLWTPLDASCAIKIGNARITAIRAMRDIATSANGATRGARDCRLSLREPAQAFAVSPKGFRFSRRGAAAREAAEAALAGCAEYASDCMLYAVDDHLAETANTGSR